MSSCRIDLTLVAVAVLLGGCGRLSAPHDIAPDSGPGVSDTVGGALHPAFGLTSVVPGEHALRVEWRATSVGASPPPIGLFVSEDPARIFDATPTIVDPLAGWIVLDGLDAGTEYWIGLGVDDGSGSFTPSGTTLRALTGAPVYVDPNAPGGGDGTTAGTPLNSLFIGILTAFSLGGGNLWIAEGAFDDVDETLLKDVHLYGGFPSDFDLSKRDVVDHPTLLLGAPGSTVLALESSATVAIVDGLVIDGRGSSTHGIDIDSHEAELRGLSIGGCTRAAKLRAAPGPAVSIRAVRCTFGTSAIEGLSVDGPFNLDFEDCSFEKNGQEGVDMDDLVAPDGGEARVVLRDCRFVDNGSEGLDIDLGAPAGGGVEGLFTILIEDCEFERNGADGLLLDSDFEGVAGWFASVTIRGCRARANLASGFHLDMDAAGSALLHRVTSSANRGDGLLLTSESLAASAVASSCAFVGNDGFGARTSAGNVGVLLTHCALSGNSQGGLSQGIAPLLATSTVAFLQPAPWSPDEEHASVVTNETQPPPFLRVPVQYLRVTASNGGLLTVVETPEFGVGTACEVADDGTAREAVQVGAGTVRVDPAPTSLATPSVLGAFASPGPVVEDYQLSASSAARGAGMSPPGGPAIDAGPFGSPAGGVPGIEELLPAPLFAVAGTTPEWSLPLAPNLPLRISFSGGAPDPGLVAAAVFVVDGSGNTLPTTVSVEGEVVVVDPPGGAWSDGSRVQVFGSLASVAGVALATPLAIPIRVVTID